MGPRRVAPLEDGIDAIERGIARRSRRVVAPGWVAAVLPIRMIVQRVVERVTGNGGLDQALEIARGENAPLTTELPDGHWKPVVVPDEAGIPGEQTFPASRAERAYAVLRDRDPE